MKERKALILSEVVVEHDQKEEILMYRTDDLKIFITKEADV